MKLGRTEASRRRERHLCDARRDGDGVPAVVAHELVHIDREDGTRGVLNIFEEMHRMTASQKDTEIDIDNTTIYLLCKARFDPTAAIVAMRDVAKHYAPGTRRLEGQAGGSSSACRIIVFSSMQGLTSLPFPPPIFK